eukprot:gene17887-biopygen7145
MRNHADEEKRARRDSFVMAAGGSPQSPKNVSINPSSPSGRNGGSCLGYEEQDVAYQVVHSAVKLSKVSCTFWFEMHIQRLASYRCALEYCESVAELDGVLMIMSQAPLCKQIVDRLASEQEVREGSNMFTVLEGFRDGKPWLPIVAAKEGIRVAPARDAVIRCLVDEAVSLTRRTQGGHAMFDPWGASHIRGLVKLLTSPQTFSVNVSDLDRAQRVLHQMHRLDRVSENNSLPALRLLRRAWDDVDIYTHEAQKMKYITKWQQLRSAAMALLSEIWKFRTRTDSYSVEKHGMSVVEDNFVSAIVAAEQNVMKSAGVEETRFLSRFKLFGDPLDQSMYTHGQYEGCKGGPADGIPFVNAKGESDKEADDHQSPVKPDEYLKRRVQPMVDLYQGRMPGYYSRRVLCEVLLVLSGLGMTFLAFLNSAHWASVISIACKFQLIKLQGGTVSRAHLA